jgi:glycerol-3-phosphate acyltransferase PlsX
MDSIIEAPVALDAEGGDHGPAEIVAGAVLAARAGTPVTLVGRAEVLEPLVAAEGARGLIDSARGLIDIVHAGEIIDPAEEPARAVRRKRGSSLVVAARLVADGRAGAMVSSGPTGAVVAAALLGLGRLPGVQRPALAVVLPVPGAPTVLLDAGASTEVTPAQLAQYARMGAAYAAGVLDVAAPRIGLLNIGEEPGKGTEPIRAAHALLSAAEPGFIGNVEGGDLWSDRVDVVVTDGFTGNIVLKSMEGTATLMLGVLKDTIGATPATRLAGAVLAPRLRGIVRDMNPDSHGGAALLGVGGNVLVAHGAARRATIAAGCAVAARAARAGLAAQIADRLAPGGGAVKGA